MVRQIRMDVNRVLYDNSIIVEVLNKYGSKFVAATGSCGSQNVDSTDLSSLFT